jgi:hypothetical protein
MFNINQTPLLRFRKLCLTVKQTYKRRDIGCTIIFDQINTLARVFK